mmetsp:Transcript_22752/g.60060  ORF Transcript_22752/g.60060 Transcript_22752/m.60060 type:complete len:202 (+) Transcript_22752:271-876(+)
MSKGRYATSFSMHGDEDAVESAAEPVTFSTDLSAKAFTFCTMEPVTCFMDLSAKAFTFSTMEPVTFSSDLSAKAFAFSMDSNAWAFWAASSALSAKCSSSAFAFSHSCDAWASAFSAGLSSEAPAAPLASATTGAGFSATPALSFSAFAGTSTSTLGMLPRATKSCPPPRRSAGSGCLAHQVASASAHIMPGGGKGGAAPR